MASAGGGRPSDKHVKVENRKQLGRLPVSSSFFFFLNHRVVSKEGRLEEEALAKENNA